MGLLYLYELSFSNHYEALVDGGLLDTVDVVFGFGKRAVFIVNLQSVSAAVWPFDDEHRAFFEFHSNRRGCVDHDVCVVIFHELSVTDVVCVCAVG